MKVKNDMTAGFSTPGLWWREHGSHEILNLGRCCEKEGMPNIARLFRGIAYAEWAHADNHFRLGEQAGAYTVASGGVFGWVKTVDNLQGAIDGELHEVEQMYPVYLEAARFQNEKTQKEHSTMLSKPKKFMQSFLNKPKTALEKEKTWI